MTATATPPLNKHRVTRAINSLLSQPRITEEDFAKFTRAEKEYASGIFTKCLSGLKGEERDTFLEKISPVMGVAGRHAVWEYNHSLISDAISNIIKHYGVMPAKETIAEKTGLSRQTVAKHLAEYTRHPMFKAEQQQFEFISNKLLAGVFRLADGGDIRAAKLYFEMVGTLNKQPSARVVSEQNNYIQINNTILSQQNLKQLSAEQLNQIEGIINGRQPEILSLEAQS